MEQFEDSDYLGFAGDKAIEKLINGEKILELCVGPSLCRLENEYKKFGMTCYGNDIDSRWNGF